MHFSDQTLLNKLAIVLVFKLAILFGLWWFFVRDVRVSVEETSVAARFLQPASPTAEGTNK